MIKEVLPYGPLNSIGIADTITVKDIKNDGVTAKDVSIADLKLILDSSNSSRQLQTKVLEGKFDLTDLGEIEFEIVPEYDYFYVLRALQVYVSEAITLSEGSTIDHLALVTGAGDPTLPLGLTAGSYFDVVTATLTNPETLVKLVALDDADEAPDGTIEGGEVKVRLIMEVVPSIATTHTLIS